ncbi:MAG: dienelactone hydrolase family protein [Dehalococcoidia bacterium]
MADVIERAVTVPGVELVDLRYPSDGYDVSALLARPSPPGPFPGVIVGQEAFGLTDHIRDVAANLAREGYVALAPDYYARTGEPEPREDVPAIMAAVDRIDNPTVSNDFLNAVAYLEETGLALPGGTGAIGFCTGGTYAMLLAIEKPDLACAALFYVSQLTYPQLNQRKPYHPIDRAGDIRCPTMVVYGDEDPVGTPERLAQLEANLKAGGVPYELKLYPGAGHAFLNPGGRLYHEEAARRAWPDALQFLARHLKG